MRPLPRLRSTLRTLLVTGVAAATASIALAAPAQADRVTPGNFTGYGFDQCLTPTQAKMDTWMSYSPFAAVGVYISGDSRACRNQPNLSKSWVERQRKNHWKILPITLGPQASCQPRFPRYGDDETIKPSSKRDYIKARKQGRREAGKAVKAAKALGIAPTSTLWYDLEGFDLGNSSCRESALRFLHAWTKRLHQLNYVSGVYSSAGSGIKMLDDVRIDRPGLITLPDAIWIARWDGVANLHTDYISDAGWQPHKRVKQYLGGHNETWGGVTINIDRNWMSLGKGSPQKRRATRCDGVLLDLSTYERLTPKNASSHVAAVKALQCTLKLRGYFDGKISGKYNAKTVAAVNGLQRRHGVKVQPDVNRRAWTILLSEGKTRPLKRGLNGAVVRRLQRALAAATKKKVPVTGVFDRRTENVTKAWQKQTGGDQSGVVNPPTWRRLQNGR